MKKDLEVEPLSDARFARAERMLFERLAREGTAAPLPSRSRAIKWGGWGVALAAAAAIVVLLWRPWSAAPPQVVGVSPSPSHFVSESSASHVALGENELDLGPRTSLVSTGDDDHGVVLVLEEGSVTCHVAPRHGRPPFVVQAGDVRVTVKGTRFTVTRGGADVTVSVESGVVDVASDGTRTELTAGGRWPAVAIVPAAPTVTVTATATASAPPAVVPSTTGRPMPDARARFEAAETLEASDPEAALGAYASLAKGSGPWAENALFAEGRLLAERGRTAEAQKVLGDYLTRYPSGPNAGDARALLAKKD